MASPDLEIQEITSESNLTDFLSKFKDENINKFIDSITYDIKSQTVIIQINNLLKHESEIVDTKHDKDSVKYSADERIQMLSENYKQQFPELEKWYNEWKPVRENLIKVMKSVSDRLSRNSDIVSVVRITTSALDIFGTLGREQGKSATSWSNFAMENSSTIGMLALIVEKLLAKMMLKDVKKALRTDLEKFKKLSEWFKQTEELDKAVKSIFPYGIDPDIVKGIAKSASDISETHKLFMSIVASNVRENVDLFKDERFLAKADQFASSEAGKQWFHKILLLSDPSLNHCLNEEVNNDIQTLLKNPPAPDSSESIIYGYKLMLSSKVKLKVFFNAYTMVLAASNLLFRNRPEESEGLREHLSKISEDLKGIETIVDCLKPKGDS